MRQSGTLMRHSECEEARVKFVKFTLLSKQEIERWAVVDLKQTRLYENKVPNRNALNDLRMGVGTRTQRCETCGGDLRQCQGHFGVIKLGLPIYHYGYLKFIEKVLKCVCHECSRLRRPKTKKDKDGTISLSSDANWKKFKAIQRATDSGIKNRRQLITLSKILLGVGDCEKILNDKNEVISGCGATIPTKIYVKNHCIEVGDSPDSLKVIDTDRVYKILRNISQEDARVMGFTDSRPVDMMIHSLLVPPPQVRPSIEMNPERMAEDDITTVYNKIIMLNNEITKPGMQQNAFDSPRRVLEASVASIMQKAVGIKSNGKAIKSFSQRLKGKQGRFRQNLMGKRVDFSARSVISPDANLALDELGVPEKIAATLTFPEEITALNFDRIAKLREQGKVLYFIKPNQDRKQYEVVEGKMPDLRRNEGNYGIIAERCLQDGDFVLFNRQPTLHRMSMMGHRVRILPYNTFRMNLSVCTPYNADFDGDEMNMHVPQSYETLAEIKHMAHVPRQIVTPKNNAPVMGMVQDALLGIYLFTLRDTFLTRQQVMNLVVWIDSNQAKQGFDQLQLGELPIPAILKPVPLWTGKQVMSMIIPNKITIESMDMSKGNTQIQKFHNAYRNLKDTNTIIRRGELITGAMQKEIVGSGAGGLVHTIWLEIGPEATSIFITTAQRIVNMWLTLQSFTVGAADIVPTKKCKQGMAQIKLNTKNLYYDHLNRFRSEKEIKEKNLHQKGKSVLDSFEFSINQILNGQLKECRKVVTGAISPYSNNIYKMIFAKSKGNETNILQIIGLLGNQNVDGKRCPEGFYKRALPHFNKDDRSPEPRGFVFSSFYEGLGPHEFFFHSMGGREGLSDTAVKTANTGYIQRRLIKALEDVIIKYDGTVRDAQGNLVQMLYGEDGFAAEYIERQIIHYQKLDKFQDDYQWSIDQLTSEYKVNEDDIETIEKQFDKLKICRQRLRKIFSGTVKNIYAPIKIERIIKNISQKEARSRPSADLSPVYVCREIDKLLDSCIHPQMQHRYTQLMVASEQLEDMTENQKRQLERDKQSFEEESGLQLFRIHVRMALASKVVCINHKLTRAGFNAIIEIIKGKFTQALIHPGEAIGAIAAQCVGEPTTQMTLNTFHSAGIADNNVTLGVPRLQELLNVSRNIKTPSLTVYLKDMVRVGDLKGEQRLVMDIMNFRLPKRYVEDYIVGSRISYDPNKRLVVTGMESEIEQEQKRKITSWVLQLKFDPGKKNIDGNVWDIIQQKVERHMSHNFKVTCSAFDFKQHLSIFLRCYDNLEVVKRSNKDEDTELDYFTFIKREEVRARKISLSGIDNIRNFHRRSVKETIKDSRGEDIEQRDYWVLTSIGSNLRQILSHPLIDPIRTRTNDITEILDVLGIEAARQSFLNEFRAVFDSYSIYVNYRHLAALADWMTRRGVLTPINRNGINRISDVSILRKASFEETVQILYDAAIFSQVDPLKGISEKIIFGQAVEIGTGNFQILIDKVKVKDFKSTAFIDKKQDLEEEISGTTYERGPHDMSQTPMPARTPDIYSGGTSYRMSQSPRPQGMSPSFTPNINVYNNRFTPIVTAEYGGMSSRSPAPFAATPTVGFSSGGLEYSPTSNSPSYSNRSPHSPTFTRGLAAYPSPYGSTYSNQNPQSPHYNSTASPSYSYASSSAHNRSSIYGSSRSHRSPKYDSSIIHASGNYSNSPSYSGTPMNAKNEEPDQEDDEDK